MKKLGVILTFLAFSVGFAQPKIKFLYDSSGNQKNRVVVLALAKNTNYKTPENLKDIDYFEADKIFYYPNPVLEELYLNWKNEISNPIESILVFDLNGQLLTSYENLQSTENVIVLFHSYASGFYNLVLKYKNGYEKNLKIVKK